MSNKKTLKMTKRNSKRGKSRKGGSFGFFKDKHNEDPNCGDPNKLVNLKDSSEMFANYKQCCPKSWYGRKNNSPYCKQLDLNYKAAFQEKQMETNANLQMIKTNQFQVDDDDTISTIDCKNPELYNSEKDIQRYIETCECNKSRLNPFSKKRKNCSIVNKKLKELQEKENFDNRAAEVFNKPQKYNYTPVNQGYSETDDETDDEYPVYMVQGNDPNAPSNIDEDYEEILSGIDYRTHQVLTGNKPPPAYGYGGKRRRTKKHFIKRSIGKRSIKKRKQKRRKTRKH